MSLKLPLRILALSVSLLSFTGTVLGSSVEQKSSIKILTPNQIKRLLGPFPAKGSAEEAQDFEALLRFQETRSVEDCELASREEKATLKNLFVIPNGPLSKKEARRISPLILKLYAEAGINIYVAKKIFKRPRPYRANVDIKPCIDLENSYSYPSGHTTMSRVLGRTLAHLYPERAEAFMKRADEVATNRILGGVHHPTDIEAGKKLGDVIFEIYSKSQKLASTIEFQN